MENKTPEKRHLTLCPPIVNDLLINKTAVATVGNWSTPSILRLIADNSSTPNFPDYLDDSSRETISEVTVQTLARQILDYQPKTIEVDKNLEATIYIEQLRQTAATIVLPKKEFKTLLGPITNQKASVLHTHLVHDFINRYPAKALELSVMSNKFIDSYPAVKSDYAVNQATGLPNQHHDLRKNLLRMFLVNFTRIPTLANKQEWSVIKAGLIKDKFNCTLAEFWDNAQQELYSPEQLKDINFILTKKQTKSLVTDFERLPYSTAQVVTDLFLSECIEYYGLMNSSGIRMPNSIPTLMPLRFASLSSLKKQIDSKPDVSLADIIRCFEANPLRLLDDHEYTNKHSKFVGHLAKPSAEQIYEKAKQLDAKQRAASRYGLLMNSKDINNEIITFNEGQIFQLPARSVIIPRHELNMSVESHLRLIAEQLFINSSLSQQQTILCPKLWSSWNNKLSKKPIDARIAANFNGSIENARLLFLNTDDDYFNSKINRLGQVKLNDRVYLAIMVDLKTTGLKPKASVLECVIYLKTTDKDGPVMHYNLIEAPSKELTVALAGLSRTYDRLSQ